MLSTAVSAGAYHSLALLGSGKVKAWGNNFAGALEAGTAESASVPVPVCAVGAKAPCTEESQQLKQVTAIAAGGDITGHGGFNLALMVSGGVVAWGSDHSGQLGQGTETGPEDIFCSKTPVAVAVPGEVSAIAAGGEHALGIGRAK